MPDTFLVRDCTVAVKATGESASSLRELRDILQRIDIGSIYYHFWGERLRPSLVHPEYHNDFAKWAHFTLKDEILSERLGIIDPTEYSTIEEVRRVLIETIEERLDEIEYAFWSKKEGRFFFLTSLIIIFNNALHIKHPSELVKILPNLPTTSIFYHFIDARRRTPDRIDDFTAWLKGFGEEFTPIITAISNVDPYFLTILEIRQTLTEIFHDYFKRNE